DEFPGDGRIVSHQNFDGASRSFHFVLTRLGVAQAPLSTLCRAGGPIRRRENDGPKTGSRKLKFKCDEKASLFGCFYAQDLACRSFVGPRVVENDGLPAEKFHTNVQQAAVGIHDEALGINVDAFSFRRFGRKLEGNTERDAFAPAAVSFVQSASSLARVRFGDVRWDSALFSWSCLIYALSMRVP